ncbi:FAD/NAD(P)-binding protein [Pseudoalteromonas luteoviolacea]|uniref:FAD/NAD(P)-binding protein n=1 Tax=Pseudoalteromonas luteoviolacea TaxID=43657 RepID=UPI001B395732|nr:FAD/NAD(P)-binding protein [Pseudoalteromonas luteoviolacea]MBQ4812726.1 FAD/NAD(P)-binding protein [Pseudoalteromonas luteoviolacea]
MHSKNIIRFCIVGTGFSGTAALVHLVKQLIASKLDCRHIELVTIEQRKSNGPGHPYCNEELLPTHLCNNQTYMMALFDNDFYDWLCEQRMELAKQVPDLIQVTHPDLEDLTLWQPDQDAFYPRALFGRYLNARFTQYCRVAQENGIRLRHFNDCQVLDGQSTAAGFTLQFRPAASLNTTSLVFDKVLLATGHWNSIKQSQYDDRVLTSPYPYSRLNAWLTKQQQRDEKTAQHICIKGMGPSGIDAILSLVESGQFSHNAQGDVTAFVADEYTAKLKLCALSRCGFFPAVRDKRIEHQFKYLTEETFFDLEQKQGKRLTLDDILLLIDKELKGASNGAIGWHDVAHPPFDSALEKLKYDASLPRDNALIHTVLLRVRRMKFYRYLNADEKQRYDSELDTHFIRTAVPIPLLNAQKLIALFEAGILSSCQLGYELKDAIKVTKTDIVVTYGQPQKQRRADGLILAAGQSFKLAHHPDNLVKSLIARGELRPHTEQNYQTGGIQLQGHESYCAMRINPNTQQVEVSPYLSSFGVLTRYWQNERNFAAAFVEAAQSVAHDWVNHIYQHTTSQHSRTDQDKVHA